MRRYAKRVYYFLKKVPLLGRILESIVNAVRKSQSKPAANVLQGAVNFNSSTVDATLAGRIALLEQCLPSVQNYIASWAETVSFLQQDELKMEIEKLTKTIEELRGKK
jgi:hypothetical protein